MLLFLIGYMGSGKTTIGKLVAQKLNYDFIDTDLELELREGMDVATIFETKGEPYFRSSERDVLHSMASKTKTVVSTGGGVPCFFDNMRWMNKKGTTIYIDLTARDLAMRLLTTDLSSRPLLAEQDEESLEEFIQMNLNQREKFYKRAKVSVSGLDDEIVTKIVQLVESNGIA